MSRVSTETGTGGPYYGNPYDSSCWPVGHDPSEVVSLATCPPGYTSACATEKPADQSVTAFQCCPSGFFCDGGYYRCSSDYGSRVTVEAKYLDSVGRTLTTTATYVGGLNAHAIKVRYHATDMASLTSSATMPSDSQTSSKPAGETTAADGGLTTGATAGIAVGAAAGGFIVAVACYFLWKRRRREGIVQRGNYQQPDQSFVQPQEAQVSGHVQGHVQPQGKGIVAELPPFQDHRELDNTERRY